MADPVASVYVNLGLSATQFQAGLKAANTSVATFARTAQTKLAGTRSAFSNLISPIKQLGTTLGLALGGTAFIALIKGAVDAGSKIGDLANQLGLTAEQVQEFSYAASQSGSSQDGFVKAMTAMNRAVGDLLSGSSEAKQTFAALGLSIDQIKGRDPSQVFELLVDRLNKLPDPLQRNAELMRLFGKSGLEMSEMVAMGAKGIDQLRMKARSSGLVLSNEDIAKLKDAGDALDTIGTAAATAQDRVAVAFAEPLERIADLVTSPGFQQGLQATAKSIGDIVGFLASNPDLLKTLGTAAAGYKFGGLPGAAIGALLPNVGISSTASPAEDEMSPEKAKLIAAGLNPDNIPTVVDNFKPVPAPGAPPPGLVDQTLDTQRQKIQKVIDGLRLQTQELGLTNRAQAENNALQKAGITNLDALDPKTRALAEAMKTQADATYDATQKFSAMNEAAQFAAQTTFDLFDGLIPKVKTGNDAIDNFVNSLEEMTLQATLLGAGPLAGMFGTASGTAAPGGIIGSIIAGLFHRAGGGAVSSGTPYMVGERGPELFVPNTSGRIAANGNAPAGGSQIVQVFNQAPGTQATTHKSRGPDGSDIIRVVIAQVGQEMAGGTFDKSMAGRYAVRPKKALGGG